MSRVSHFQRFSQPENHATNNTLLVLRHFYQSSPFKIQRVLTSLLETDLSIGLAFEQRFRQRLRPRPRVFLDASRGRKLYIQADCRIPITRAVRRI